jgi:hypothetical protein
MVKFWETAPAATGYRMRSIEFDSRDEAVEYARSVAPGFKRIESRGTYVVANTDDASHTLELGRKGDPTAAAIMETLTV